MDTHTLSADVYAIGDALYAKELDYLWDFGSFTCVGTERIPVAAIRPYHHVVEEQDDEWVASFENRRVQQEFRTFDYAVYVPTTNVSDDVLDTPIAQVRYCIDGYPYEYHGPFTIEDKEGTYVRLEARHDERVVTKERFEERQHEGGWEQLLLITT